MNYIKLDIKRRNAKRHVEEEIRKVRSGIGQNTDYKFTRNIDSILEQYSDYMEDSDCGRIVEDDEGATLFFKRKTKNNKTRCLCYNC